MWTSCTARTRTCVICRVAWRAGVVEICSTNTHLQEEFGKRLNKVMALTAFGDPLYCEAIVTMHSYDIVLDIFIVNRTAGHLPRLMPQ